MLSDYKIFIGMLFLLVLAACAQPIVETGDTVSVHYTGLLANGSEFDSSVGSDPLTFTVGGGRLLPKFEEAVIGLSEGESTTVMLSAQEGYGEYDISLVQIIPREQITADGNLAEGMYLMATTPDGRQRQAHIIELTNETITLDMNHRLAGETLTFEIEVVEIVKG